MTKFFNEYPNEKWSIVFDECNSPEKNKVFRHTIDTYHAYMKYKDTCNRRINWNIYETQSGNLIGGVGINSAILSLGPRDTYIGWNKATRLKHINQMANNYRFCLIKDNITIDNVGTQVLKRLRKESVTVWRRKYGDELVMLETLVKPPWSGAIYKADNWLQCGMTKGYSFSKAPLKLWQKEDSARGELARNDPKAAVEKYAVGKKMYDVTTSEPKIIFIKFLTNDWQKKLM